jgi:predicted RNA-binding protein
MCDTDAFILKNGAEEKVLESVDRIDREGDELTLTNIFGDQRTFRARLMRFDNNEGKLLFELI